MSRQAYIKLIESESLLNNRYKNIKAIDANGGAGYFSIVFKAHAIDINSKVILKFFDPMRIGEAERVKRFHREADLLRELGDEDSVIGYIEGVSTYNCLVQSPSTGATIPFPMQYIAMDLADSNLEEFIYNGNLKPIDKLLIFKEIVKAVTRLHNRKICHRDLKPSNFLLKKNKIFVSDLGASKIFDNSLSNISRNYIEPIGDLSYTSPEPFAALGIADEYTFLSDIFSLGAILFEMFSLSVLTQEIYTPAFMGELLAIKSKLLGLPENDRVNMYLRELSSISNSVQYPDIYSYNSNVPNCIKIHLNNLYKSLTAINFRYRLRIVNSIHRQLDICIITLRNEQIYQKWNGEKEKRRVARMKKNLHRLRRINDTKKP